MKFIYNEHVKNMVFKNYFFVLLGAGGGH